MKRFSHFFLWYGNICDVDGCFDSVPSYTGRNYGIPNKILDRSSLVCNTTEYSDGDAATHYETMATKTAWTFRACGEGLLHSSKCYGVTIVSVVGYFIVVVVDHCIIIETLIVFWWCGCRHGFQILSVFDRKQQRSANIRRYDRPSHTKTRHLPKYVPVGNGYYSSIPLVCGHIQIDLLETTIGND